MLELLFGLLALALITFLSFLGAFLIVMGSGILTTYSERRKKKQ